MCSSSFVYLMSVDAEIGYYRYTVYRTIYRHCLHLCPTANMRKPNTIMLVLRLYLYYYLALAVNKYMLDSARQNKLIKRHCGSVEPWEVTVRGKINELKGHCGLNPGKFKSVILVLILNGHQLFDFCEVQAEFSTSS